VDLTCDPHQTAPQKQIHNSRAALGDDMGRIVDLVETSPGHHLALLRRVIQLVRIAERDRSRRIEPPDLVIAQGDREGGEVIS
jgi:hypothetical protein